MNNPYERWWAGDTIPIVDPIPSQPRDRVFIPFPFPFPLSYIQNIFKCSFTKNLVLRHLLIILKLEINCPNSSLNIVKSLKIATWALIYHLLSVLLFFSTSISLMCKYSLFCGVTSSTKQEVSLLDHGQDKSGGHCCPFFWRWGEVCLAFPLHIWNLRLRG